MKMKTKNLQLLFLAVLIYGSQLSCTKEFNKPMDNSGGVTPTPITSVVPGNWFSANWETSAAIKQFIKVAPEINLDLLNNGKILVYGKGGFEMRSETALPSSFDKNYIDATKDFGEIKFILQGDGAISPSLQFRYILIPPNKIVKDGFLDYNDYHAVCDYYHVAE